MCFANGIMFCEHWIATKIVRVGRDMEHYPLTYLYMQIATSKCMHKKADLNKIKLKVFSQERKVTHENR